jgi:hypothetical protein
MLTIDRSRTGEEMRWMIDKQSESKIVFKYPWSFSTTNALLMEKPSASQAKENHRYLHCKKG